MKKTDNLFPIKDKAVNTETEKVHSGMTIDNKNHKTVIVLPGTLWQISLIKS